MKIRIDLPPRAFQNRLTSTFNDN